MARMSILAVALLFGAVSGCSRSSSSNTEASKATETKEGQPATAQKADSQRDRERTKTFEAGVQYFIWSAESGPVRSRNDFLRMLIGFEYEVNPKAKAEPFGIHISFIVKDPDSGELRREGTVTKPDLKEYGQGKTGAMFLGGQSLRGKGDATIYLVNRSDNEKKISNTITVPVVFD